jgi:DNA/RNA endonuclease G (NUC1)
MEPTRAAWSRRTPVLLAPLAALLLAACAQDGPSPTAPAAPAEQPSFYTYPSAIYRSHVEFGIPTCGSLNSTTDYRLSKRTHYLSYNQNKGGPNWVSWNLNKTHYGDAPRSTSFYADASLPSGMYRVVSSDYTNGGYDRGHMVRSEERTWSADDNKQTFLMTNILPQTHDLNGGPWYKFEAYLQGLAQNSNKEIYVIAGGSGSYGTLKGEGKVTIPRYTWKIAVIMPYGHGLANATSTSSLQVIAVDMPNVTGISGKDWTAYRTTVDRLESFTNCNFLHKLPDAVETYWESRT